MALDGKMTAAQAAELIGIDGTNLRKKLKAGIIPSERHGWAYVLDIKDVMDFKERYQKFSKLNRPKKAART